MRLRNIPRSTQTVATSCFVIQNPVNKKNQWHKVFGNVNPIYLEIGMGKGKFLETLARTHTEINYLGMERYTSVLLRAVERLEAAEQPLANLRFLCEDAGQLTEFFAPLEIDRIYLNFSDPWPKTRHAARRLPSGEFLERYGQILSKDGQIEFKTDNRGLFEFALREAMAAGWTFLEKTYDLHRDTMLMETNVMTEYEEKFSSIGNPICKYVISRTVG